LIVWQVLGLVLLVGRTSATKDVELHVLRHQVALLRRTNPRRVAQARPPRRRVDDPAASNVSTVMSRLASLPTPNTATSVASELSGDHSHSAADPIDQQRCLRTQV
jgi:hypothetical protein